VLPTFLAGIKESRNIQGEDGEGSTEMKEMKTKRTEEGNGDGEWRNERPHIR